ncbi:MAG: methyltransferase domain-containing protein [Clostridiales bacterium]|nr:methyltransferase domain-containing protein [Clostridiales bacterium]
MEDKKLLDKINAAYDGELGEDMKVKSRQRINWICDKARGNRILDVGCSQGVTSLLLGREGKCVTGIDIEPAQIKYANEKLNGEFRETKENVKFICGDFSSYEFDSEQFDTIIMGECLEHVFNPTMFLGKAKELLTKKGRLIVTVPFGINPFPDHKRTYYFLELFEQIKERINVESICFFGGWIGFVADRDLSETQVEIDRELLAKIENAFFQVDTKCNEKINYFQTSHNTLKNKLAKLNRENTSNKIKNNNKFKALDEEIKELINENKTLFKEKEKVNALNSMLYKSKRTNAAYERIPGVKIYNILRRFKHLNKNDNYFEEVLYQKEKPEYPEVFDTSKMKFDASIKDISDKKKHTSLFMLRDDCTSLKKLKVACIMDTFTYGCFAPECNLLRISPEKWEDEIKEFCPDMVFVESAWHGNDDQWKGQIDYTGEAFVQLIKYCSKKKIPVVFWCKEDPVHTELFMKSAGLCDFVFTTEMDCINTYVDCLGHERIYLLHFAAQPKLHNPAETFERRDKFCFAGTYYRKYPKRLEVFNNFTHYAMRHKGIDIYDRNYGKNIKSFEFPEFYAPFILGSLEPEEIERAYKGYSYGINMNSAPESSTMFARRVFEMMASNGVVVSNASDGQNKLFGKLTLCTDSIYALDELLEKYCSNVQMMHNYRLQGFRRVSQQHLYEDRLDYIVKKVFGRTLKEKAPLITVVSIVKSQDELQWVKAMFDKQSFDNRELVVCAEFDNDYLIRDMKITSNRDSLIEYVNDSISEGFIAYFDPSDWYGENYLLDLSLMLRYDDYDAIGKTVYYEKKAYSTILCGQGKVYTKAKELDIRRAIISIRHIDKINKFIITNNGSLNLFSTDEFNYCLNGKGEPCQAATDLIIEDSGTTYRKLEEAAEKRTEK